ncbi:MAG: GIY-YIG nuclease family protein [Bacteroidota bacterium]
MWNVYVIQSLKSGVRYTGMATDVLIRVSEHNAGKSKFTSGHIPWKLIYQESGFKNSADARGREKYLKSAAGKKFVEKNLSE